MCMLFSVTSPSIDGNLNSAREFVRWRKTERDLHACLHFRRGQVSRYVLRVLLRTRGYTSAGVCEEACTLARSVLRMNLEDSRRFASYPMTLPSKIRAKF